MTLDDARARFTALFKVIGAEQRTCSSCGASMFMVRSRHGRLVPYTVDGISHFADCPDAARHRRSK